MAEAFIASAVTRVTGSIDQMDDNARMLLYVISNYIIV